MCAIFGQKEIGNFFYLSLSGGADFKDGSAQALRKSCVCARFACYNPSVWATKTEKSTAPMQRVVYGL